MTMPKSKTATVRHPEAKKTLSLRKETLRDLTPRSGDVRGGVSGSGATAGSRHTLVGVKTSVPTHLSTA